MLIEIVFIRKYDKCVGLKLFGQWKFGFIMRIKLDNKKFE